MIVNVRLFASAREQAAADTVALSVPPLATLDLLRESLDEAVPALRGQPGRWAVNREFALAGHVVKAEDDLAWIPPVSGG